MQGLLVGLGEIQLLSEPNHARIPSIYRYLWVSAIVLLMLLAVFN